MLHFWWNFHLALHRVTRGQVFRGPGFQNGSLTCINLRHSLACHRQCGDTSFMSSLSHQFLTSHNDPGALPPSYSPTPHELLHFETTLGATTVQSLSGGLVPFGNSQACRFRHGYSPLELPPSMPYGTESIRAPTLVSTFLSVSPRASMPSSPNPGQWPVGMESSGGSCSLPFRIEVAAISRQTDGYDHPRSVVCRASTVRCTRLPRSTFG